MAAKLTTLSHKIAIQLHLVAESCTILAPGGQSGNFWIHTPMDITPLRIEVMHEYLAREGGRTLNLHAFRVRNY
jgi:hypothetical protein